MQMQLCFQIFICKTKKKQHTSFSFHVTIIHNFSLIYKFKFRSNTLKFVAATPENVRNSENTFYSLNMKIFSIFCQTQTVEVCLK